MPSRRPAKADPGEIAAFLAKHPAARSLGMNVPGGEMAPPALAGVGGRGKGKKVPLAVPGRFGSFARTGGPLLSLDVSSSACGWAARDWDGVVTFGVLRPQAKRPSVDRIDAIASGVEAIVTRVNCLAVVMEWTAGRTHGRLAHASGLAILGHAQGAVRERLRSLGLAGEDVWLVPENAWTGSKPKVIRAKAVRLAHPTYAEWAGPVIGKGKDAGLDAADGLGLLDWAIGRAREAALLQRGA